MTSVRPIAVGLAAVTACTSAGEDPSSTVGQHGDLAYPNARWVEGNSSPIEANGSPIEANARRIDGVTSRSLGINDHLANAYGALTPEAIDAAASQGWYLPSTTDVIVEGYPASFTGFDRCAALDGGAASEWRVTPSTPID